MARDHSGRTRATLARPARTRAPALRGWGMVAGSRGTLALLARCEGRPSPYPSSAPMAPPASGTSARARSGGTCPRESWRARATSRGRRGCSGGRRSWRSLSCGRDCPFDASPSGSCLWDPPPSSAQPVVLAHRPRELPVQLADEPLEPLLRYLGPDEGLGASLELLISKVTGCPSMEAE